jgi:hypothetical protein
VDELLIQSMSVASFLALNDEKRRLLKCQQLEDKRTSPRHRGSDVHDAMDADMILQDAKAPAALVV